MAKKGLGLSVKQLKSGSWRAQIRKVGFPPQSKNFLSQKEANAWAIPILEEMQKTGTIVDRRASGRTTFGEAIRCYITEETAKRRSAISRRSEEDRLNRFLREEAKLCAFALSNLTPGAVCCLA